MITNVEQVEPAAGAKEQTRAIKPRPKLDRETAGICRKRPIEGGDEPAHAGSRETQRNDARPGEGFVGLAVQSDDVQTDALSSPNNARTASRQFSADMVGTSR